MKYTNDYNLSPEICHAILDDNYDHNHDKKTLSATTLIKPLKQLLLTLNHEDDLIEDVSDNIWRMFGNAMHSVLQTQQGRNKLVEKRLVYELNGFHITGKPDLYDIEKRVLTDYKVTSVWTILYNPSGKKEWEQQLNIYAWLLKKLDFQVSKAEVVMILRDWNKKESLKSINYPQTAIHTIEIPIWAESEQESFILAKVDAFVANRDKPEDSIPVCTPEERWAIPDKYAIMKKGGKRAVKVFDSREEADKFLSSEQPNLDNNMFVEERKGKDNRCIGYCLVNRYCNYWRENYETRD